MCNLVHNMMVTVCAWLMLCLPSAGISVRVDRVHTQVGTTGVNTWKYWGVTEVLMAP